MATTTTNFGWDIPQSTDLVKDGATAIAALGQDIDTALVDLKGGTTGQVLSKASGTDLDFTWVAQDDSNAIQNAIVDAKGDLITATAADTPARLAAGANGLVLETASGESTGLKWGFKGIVQVIYGSQATAATNSTNTYANTNLTATITPKSASNKVLVMTAQFLGKAGDVSSGAWCQLLRDATVLNQFATYFGYTNTVNSNLGCATFNYLDSPATTSAVVYKTQFKNNVNAASVSANEGTSTMILVEVSV